MATSLVIPFHSIQTFIKSLTMLNAFLLFFPFGHFLFGIVIILIAIHERFKDDVVLHSETIEQPNKLLVRSKEQGWDSRIAFQSFLIFRMNSFVKTGSVSERVAGFYQIQAAPKNPGFCDDRLI